MDCIELLVNTFNYIRIKEFMTAIREVITSLESVAPPYLQESYDNAGLIERVPA